MGIPREQIERLRAALKEAPEVPPGSADTTKQEAVRLLAGDIQALQQRGYSLEQVAEMFRSGGLVLTTPTLKSYLSRAKGGRKRRRAGQRTETGGGAKAPAAVVVVPRASRTVVTGGEKKEATTANPSVAVAKPRPGGEADDGRKQDGAPEGGKLLSGKDAFRTTDKEEY